MDTIRSAALLPGTLDLLILKTVSLEGPKAAGGDAGRKLSPAKAH